MLNSEIRSKILKERWLLPPPTKTKYDHTIYLKTLTFIKNKSIKNYIGLYWPIEGEVDTIALIDELLRLKYRVCLPYIENKKMVYKQIKNTNFDCEF
jgi:5-formyltetrahydrofolate cyclo-ligase